nr:MAG TPA: hypothetical protein [Caudoviricetes sp.]
MIFKFLIKIVQIHAYKCFFKFFLYLFFRYKIESIVAK